MEESPDQMKAYDFQFPYYKVSINGKQKDFIAVSNIQNYKAGKYDKRDFLDHYAKCFQSDYGETVLVNPEQKDRNVLIVSDSFGNITDPLFSTHYKNTFLYDPRHTDATLDEFIAKNKASIDDVIFVTTYPMLTHEKFIAALKS